MILKKIDLSNENLIPYLRFNIQFLISHENY